MTSLYPHTPYAEDQPSAHAILYTHTIRAGAMAGTFLSLFTAPASLLISRYRYNTPLASATFIPRLLSHSGRGLLFGALFGAAATYGRMTGREEIEWQDRAWRLHENRGEMDTDFVALGGAGVGALAAWAAKSRGGLVGLSAGKAALGGAGLGMACGVGYMVSTYLRGRRPA
ncbi:hypothetical protein K458DRAFT_413632 [Lentithecium fluviatile CBS 122367]|uniref:Uncharacterized protein n=1 Tax=Lentithecium fluviatile CBS 122367 TaxID=1168545 RepID=A0A6G1JFW5_9PLEO|nr:hypothetical protein K458DRAFT_413632 [Lentithecium fluviatile CBS 122367]